MIGDMSDLLADRRRIAFVAVVIIGVLVLAGRVLLRPSHASTVPPPLRVARAPGPAKAERLYVDVVGAVRRPGLYRVARGARVADAVARAGGPTRKAELELVNLAALLADGEQVVVPRRGATTVASGSGGSASAPSGPVHLNTATLEQLDELPGVGPVTAQKIIDYRTQHGGFGSVDELDAVPGIGPARLADLRSLVAP
jgi:competence protein ComEA